MPEIRTLYPPEIAARRQWLAEQMNAEQMNAEQMNAETLRVRRALYSTTLDPLPREVAQARQDYSRAIQPFYDELLRIEEHNAFPFEVTLTK